MQYVSLNELLRVARIGQRELARALGASPTTINRLAHGHTPPLKGWGELKTNLEAVLVEYGVPAHDASALVTSLDEQWQASRHHADAVARAKAEGASVDALPAAGRPRHLPTDRENCRSKHAPSGQELSEEELMLLSKQSLTPQARKHFKLFRDPWDDPHLPEEVFLTPESRYVYEAMMSAARHGNFLAVIGESGSGKTTLRRMMLEQLKDDGQTVIIQPYILTTGGKGAEDKPLRAAHIAESILACVDPGGSIPSSAEARARRVHEVLRQSSSGGNRHLLFIEEAHDINLHTFKSLKRFFELEDGMKRLLSIVLLGQTELAEKFSNSGTETREVVQRCDVVKLPPLTDVPGYLRHRFKTVQADPDGIFDTSGMEALRQRLIVAPDGRGRGADLAYPLAVQNLATRAMNLAVSIGEPVVTADVVRQVRA
ncbi:MAG: AAA family ATPase [Desulfovibrio sp.]|nr:AAA family ATPase [Desulfovibrio sp.]